MRRMLIVLVACVLVSVPVVGDTATERRIEAEKAKEWICGYARSVMKKSAIF